MNLKKQQKKLQECKHGQKPRYPGDTRTEYQRDYGCLLHSYSFRRLQSKTQTLGTGESDGYRTRLTHSLEVMQIGQGIVWFLKEKYKKNKIKLAILPDDQLISTICLAHDIGHPPFGHGGEIALNAKMYSYGGFEGNGQTFRLMTLDNMNYTRRVLLGVIKYPIFFQPNGNESPVSNNNLIKKDIYTPKKSLFKTEKPYFDWVMKPFSCRERIKFKKSEGNKTKYKSLDCSIMDLADDIAYACHDLQDAITMGLIKVKTLTQFKEILNLDSNEEQYFEDLCSQYNFEQNFDKNNRNFFFSKMIGHFIRQSMILEDPCFKSFVLKYNVDIDCTNKKILERFKDLAFRKIIKKREVQMLEFKGQKIILDLFDAFLADPKRLLKEDDWLKYNNCKGNIPAQMRIICDYIAGMTDTYAQRTHNYLFNPRKGSALLQF